MRITDAFLAEHGVFYAQFDHLEDVLARGASAQLVGGQAALLAAGLVPHAMLENELLIAELERRRGPDGPTSAMREDHESIEAELEQAGRTRDAAAAAAHLLEAIRQAREHFSREELVLFPLAEEVMDDGTLRDLGDAWAERRKVSVAP